LKEKLLVSAPVEFVPGLTEYMEEEFECFFSYQFNEAQIKNLLKDNDFIGWVVSPCPTYDIDAKLFDLCPSLKIVSTPSTGTNHINFKDASKRKINIFSLKGTTVVEEIKASSEFTFNLLISTIRKTPYAFQGVLRGEWRTTENKYRGRELSGLSLGIIGFGRIGGNLAKYASAFDMNIMAYDPYKKISLDYVNQFEELDKMLSLSDVISVCVHLNDETKGMINNKLFSKMKNGVYFINTSRGDIVNESDLINNLNNGKIYAAGLDVISNEFLGNMKEHPLIKYAKENENLIITPHIAGLTYESERKAQIASFEAVKSFIKN
jgi:D-3-phosphoglycerate dehydrogenase / 2-oxoglutarate reductase